MTRIGKKGVGQLKGIGYPEALIFLIIELRKLKFGMHM